MTKFEFVTTFSVDGYHCYGQRFVDSFVEMSRDIPLTIYHESQPNVDFHQLLTWRNLDHDDDRRRFLEQHGSDPEKVADARFPNSQAIRFCHKVFALTHAVSVSHADYVIWCDADVVFHKPITEDLLESVVQDSDVAFLGRVDMPYTECGFVAYNRARQRVQSMVDDMRHYYTSGEIFSKPKHWWHDSKCFDFCLSRSSIPDHKRLNLSDGVRGQHVWPNTILAQFSKHQKGPARKHKTYGGIVP